MEGEEVKSESEGGDENGDNFIVHRLREAEVVAAGPSEADEEYTKGRDDPPNNSKEEAKRSHIATNNNIHCII